MDQAARNNYKFICFTGEGRKLMKRLISKLFEDEEDIPVMPVETGHLDDFTADNFKQGNILVFIGACGIAVRAIAPYIADKTRDAAVIVIDEKGKFVIPILSGHLGGGVKASLELAGLIGATPVVTTATDVRGDFAVDVFAGDNDLGISDMKKAKAFTAYLLENHKAYYGIDPEYKDVIMADPGRDNLLEIQFPPADESVADGFVVISPQIPDGKYLQLIPGCIVLGIGCRKGKAGSEIIEFAERVLGELSLDERSVTAVASIDLKKDEKGILELSEKYGAKFVTFSKEILMQQKGDFSVSDFVREKVGADNVCERSLAAYGCKRIIMNKRAENGMTIAIGVVERQLRYGQ